MKRNMPLRTYKNEKGRSVGQPFRLVNPSSHREGLTDCKGCGTVKKNLPESTISSQNYKGTRPRISMFVKIDTREIWQRNKGMPLRIYGYVTG